MLLDGAQLNRMTRACEVCEEPRAHRTPRPGEGQRARGTGPQKTPEVGRPSAAPPHASQARSPRAAGLVRSGPQTWSAVAPALLAETRWCFKSGFLIFLFKH